jgi:hypothetical protein
MSNKSKLRIEDGKEFRENMSKIWDKEGCLWGFL